MDFNDEIRDLNLLVIPESESPGRFGFFGDQPVRGALNKTTRPTKSERCYESSFEATMR